MKKPRLSSLDRRTRLAQTIKVIGPRETVPADNRNIYIQVSDPEAARVLRSRIGGFHLSDISTGGHDPRLEIIERIEAMTNEELATEIARYQSMEE